MRKTRKMFLSMQEAIERTSACKGTSAGPSPWAGGRLLLALCLGQAPQRTCSLIEPLDKTVAREMKGSADKGVWPILVYL